MTSPMSSNFALSLMEFDDLYADAKRFEERLGLPVGFYERLLQEDDWSFVIKLNALFEGACTHALVARLRAPVIEEQLARLQLADSSTGKVKLLTVLGSISPEQATFMRRFAELRNTLVHNVARIVFDYVQYLASLNSNQRDQFVKVFGCCWKKDLHLGGKQVSRTNFVLENPKLSVWFASIEILACLHLEFELADIKFKTTVLEEYRKIASEWSDEA